MLRHWLYLTAWAAIAFVFVFPADAWLSHFLEPLPIGGDVKRTLQTIQQFGDLPTLILIGLVIFLLDPRRRRLLYFMAGNALAVAVACWVLKICLGRPRPVLQNPWMLILPWETYPLPAKDHPDGSIAVHAWNLAHPGIASLWSTPSSHTAAAVALAMFLYRLYPALKPLLIAVVVIVAVARVLLQAHYLSDVVLGAWVGYSISLVILRRVEIAKI